LVKISKRQQVGALKSFAQKVFSFTPGFSPVSGNGHYLKTVSAVFRAFAKETVETVS
jgi:hypothetical protein